MSKRCSYCENVLPNNHANTNLICRRCKSVKNKAIREGKSFNFSSAATLIEQEKQRERVEYLLATYGHPSEYVVPHEVITWKKRSYYKRRGWLNTIQYGEGCIDCGELDVRVLSFDHRPNSGKLFNIADKWGGAADMVLAEVAKCDIRCHNCHAKRTHKDMYTVTNITSAPVQQAFDILQLI